MQTNPYERLRQRLEAGTWPIPNAAGLLHYCRRALAGDEEARAEVHDYLAQPGVLEQLGMQS